MLAHPRAWVPFPKDVSANADVYVVINTVEIMECESAYNPRKRKNKQKAK